LLARAEGTSIRARRAGLICYGLAQIGLIIAWIRWLTVPAHDELTQNGLGAATFLAMVFGFSAAYLMCADTRGVDRHRIDGGGNRGMGRDLPVALYSKIVDAIESAAKRALVGAS